MFLFSSSAYPFQPIQLTLISALFIGAPSFLLALEPNKDRVQGRFIANVLKKALPGGLTVVLGIGALLVLQNIFSIPQERLSVMAVYVTAGVLYGVLFRVCKPFRKWHIIMLAVVPAVFCAACWLVSPLFYIVPLNFSEWLCIACVIPGELLIFWGLVNLLGRILGRWSGGFPPMPRAKKTCAGTVLALSAAYAVWLFLILADYLAVRNGAVPIFTMKQPDGTNSGLLYTITDGVFHVFGRDIIP